MQLRALAAAVSITLGTLTSAGAQPSAAAERLENVRVFAFGGVGFAGTTSAGERDFRAIMAEGPDRALPLFEKVYKHGTAEAKSYALTAIRQLNPERFNQLLAAAVNSPDKVETMHGCSVDREIMSAVAKQIASGSFDPWLKRKLRATNAP